MSTTENPMRFAARGSCAAPAPAAGRRWAWHAVMLALGPALAGWHGAGLAQEEVKPVAAAQTRARPDATLPGVTVTAKGYAAERESTPMATHTSSAASLGAKDRMTGFMGRIIAARNRDDQPSARMSNEGEPQRCSTTSTRSGSVLESQWKTPFTSASEKRPETCRLATRVS